MLTFRNANIALVTSIGVLFWYSMPWWVYVLLLLVYTGVVVWGAMKIHSGFFMPVYCAASTTEKVVALTFDDGPLTFYTPEILDILKQEQAPAAFFCIGNRIEGQEPLLKRMQEEGHIIGNHSFSHHFWFDLFSDEKMLTELRLVDAAVEKVIGKRPRLFRPPYGVTNPNVRRATQTGNYSPIGWNIRSLDTVSKEADKLLSRITDSLQPGSIILLHDSVALTVQILPTLIAHVRKEGYTIKRVDQLLNIPAYA